MQLVTVIGGSGVFGRRIAEDLAAHENTRVRIVGRSASYGGAFASSLSAEFITADINDDAQLAHAIDGSTIVIHTAGPFQARDYRVAEACIRTGCHYIDIADARRFVIDISSLDQAARRRGVFVTSGASSVPAITHAMCAALHTQFQTIDTIQIALSPGNQNPRGASTIGAILSYLGRPIRLWQDNKWMTRFGWGDAMHLQFPEPVGRRHVYNCDVPDLDLFPTMLSARTVRFHAGVELNIINRILSGVATMQRIAPLPNIHRLAPFFLRGSLLLYRFGSKNGALAVWMQGRDHNNNLIEKRMAIVTDNDGPATPSCPAIILAKKILNDGPPRVGASPCVGFITFDEIESHLHRFGVWIAHGDVQGWSIPPAQVR